MNDILLFQKVRGKKVASLLEVEVIQFLGIWRVLVASFANWSLYIAAVWRADYRMFMLMLCCQNDNLFNTSRDAYLLVPIQFRVWKTTPSWSYCCFSIRLADCASKLVNFGENFSFNVADVYTAEGVFHLQLLMWIYFGYGYLILAILC